MDHHRQDIREFSLLPFADDSRLQKKQGAPGIMCEEEWKIRGELESEIERELEEEIKDGIYHLALRLHRLYQHKRERNNGEDLSKEDNALSEVNISIKMEGGTKIEIKETKKQTPPRAKKVSVKGMMVRSKPNGKKKFDWANSLRERNEPAIVRNGNINGVNNKHLEVGWKW